MEILLFDATEPVPYQEDCRLGRVGNYAHKLVDRKKNVTWITSNYSHSLKRYLKPEEKRSPNGIKIKFLNGLPYKKNISLMRVVNNIFLGIQSFFYILLLKEKENIKICCSCPLIEIAFAASLNSRINNNPLAIDVRDDWPDIFINHLPKSLRKIEKIIFWPWRFMLSYSLRSAIKITATSLEQAKMAEKYSDTKLSEIHVFYIGDQTPDIGVSKKNSNKVTLLFIGTLSPSRPLENIINNLQHFTIDIELQIVGDGDLYEEYKTFSSEFRNIIFHGKQVGARLDAIASKADILVAPYADNYGVSLPTKIATYIGYGRPIITNINKETGKLLRQYHLGSVIDFSDHASFNEAIYHWSDINKEEHFEKSRKLFYEQFNISVISDQIAELLISL